MPQLAIPRAKLWPSNRLSALTRPHAGPSVPRLSRQEGPSMADDIKAVYDASRFSRAGRGKIFDSIIDTIGDTPLIRLPNLTKALKPKGEVLAKLEFFNPLGSVKDRIG